MIDRYTLKVAPATSHLDFLKKLDEMKDYNEEDMRKLNYLKVRSEAVCEAADLKKIVDLLKELPNRKG